MSRPGFSLDTSMTTLFSRGFVTPTTAIALLLQQSGLKRYAVVPLIVNVILYGCVIGLGITMLAHWQPHVGPWDFGWGLGRLLANAINFLFATLKWIAGIPLLLLVCYATFTMVGMVVASPFNDLLSDRVERRLCLSSECATLPWGPAMKSMAVSLLDALVIVLKQGLFSLLVLPLLLVPIIGFVPLLIVTSYFTGLGFIDVAMARNHLRRRHKHLIIADRRWEILGLGLAMELLFFVPFVGLLVLPIGVTAGTILYCRYPWTDAMARRGVQLPRGFLPPRLRPDPPVALPPGRA